MKIVLTFFLLSLTVACSVKKDINGNSSQQSDDNILARMFPDGKTWMIRNLEVDVPGSYCHHDDTVNCKEYGRLYTWAAAREGCRQLGNGWRLPTDGEWQTLAKEFGGIYDDSQDKGKSAYESLVGDDSQFNALLAGNRESNGSYERLGAHGFYWTATEYDSANAWFYNFAKGSVLLNHHSGDKGRAVSVRCIKD